MCYIMQHNLQACCCGHVARLLTQELSKSLLQRIHRLQSYKVTRCSSKASGNQATVHVHARKSGCSSKPPPIMDPSSVPSTKHLPHAGLLYF